MMRILAFRPDLGPDPHRFRTKAIVGQYPAIRGLIGNNPWTLACIIGLLALQLGIAFLLCNSPLWAGAALGALVGAVPALGLYFLMHECSHHLVFRNRRLNVLTGILANCANVIPYAILYTTHHLKHHSSQGDSRADPDMPANWEARLIGGSTIRKGLWLLFNPVFQFFRGSNLSAVKSPRGWLALNVVAVLAVDAAVLVTLGPTALVYLFCSYFFAMGLPLGAFWIPEHYSAKSGQETYSYYGWLNWLLFNRGYHTEHHDFPSIPWSRLPRLRRIAPEWYDGIRSHRSYFAALVHFAFNPEITMYSRVNRTPTE